MTRAHRLLAIVAATFGIAAGLSDLRPVDAVSLAADIDAERDHLSAPDLATRIMDRDPVLRVFDLRSPAEYAQFHIPGAKQVSIEGLSREPLPRDASIVLYSEGGAHAAQAWVLLRMRGYRRVFFLREGIYEWVARVFEPRLATDATPAERAEFARAAAMSRFFGGVPREDVPRAEVPSGYWSAAPMSDGPSATSATAAPQLIARIRRRGC